MSKLRFAQKVVRSLEELRAAIGPQRFDRAAKKWIALFGIGIYVGIGFGVYYIAINLEGILHWILTYLGSIALTIFAIMIGLLAYAFKLFLRFVYGLIEILIGIISVILYTSLASPTTQSIIQILGGIYIIVRGLDNAYESLSSDNQIKKWIVRQKQGNAPSTTSPT